MNNKIIFIGITLLILVFSYKTTIGFRIVTNNILYVDDDGTADFVKIQNAIDNASEGDIIFVYNGTYHENIIINKTSIQLIGESKNSTIIDGSGFEYVIFIRSRNDIIISNFTIRNSSSSGKGIRIGDFLPCLDIIIKNNIISNTSIGIFTPSTLMGFRNNHKSVKIVENEIKNSFNYGIDFHVTEFSIIDNNNFIKNRCGINLEWSNGNIIKNNNFIDNEIDAVFDSALFTKCNSNYYSNHKIMSPYIIHGTLFEIEMPWLIIDWHPAQEPYDI